MVQVPEQEMREWLMHFSQSLSSLSALLRIIAAAGEGTALAQAYRAAKAIDASSEDIMKTFQREQAEMN